MPEGDTVWRTADRLHRALAGALVTRVELRWPSAPLVDLSGTRTTEVLARGKHLLHRFDTGVTLHTHLRMEGQWRVEHPGARTERVLRREDLRAAVLTDTWSAVGLRLGMLDLVPTERERELVSHLGPDVLGPDWDPALAAARPGWQGSTGIQRAGEEAYVHARSGRPCRRCGDTVRVALTGRAPAQRTLFSCPTCQGGLAPTDDGRPQHPLGSSPGPSGGYRRRGR